MPSSVNSTTPFRPARWILIGAICCAVAYAFGYSKGVDDNATTAPTTITTPGQP